MKTFFQYNNPFSREDNEYWLKCAKRNTHHPKVTHLLPSKDSHPKIPIVYYLN